MVVGTILGKLAEVLREQGDLKKAEELLGEEGRITRKHTGFEHPAILNKLAKVLRDRGKFAEADPLFERALAGVEKMRPPGHPDIAGVLVPTAESLEQQKKFAKAKPLAERALAIQEKALESGHPDFEDTFEVLRKIHAGLGDKEKAAAYLARADDLRAMRTKKIEQQEEEESAP
jgi:tetratricopeptide (TPR) repeat protein